MVPIQVNCSLDVEINAQTDQHQLPNGWMSVLESVALWQEEIDWNALVTTEEIDLTLIIRIIDILKLILLGHTFKSIIFSMQLVNNLAG